jgi:hypothetical protein
MTTPRVAISDFPKVPKKQTESATEEGTGDNVGGRREGGEKCIVKSFIILTVYKIKDNEKDM